MDIKSHEAQRTPDLILESNQGPSMSGGALYDINNN